MQILFIALGAASIVVYITAAIMIYAYLKERDKTIASFLLINLYIFRYVSQYREITKKENGQIGPLYYLWIISINVVLVCVLLLIYLGVIK